MDIGHDGAEEVRAARTEIEALYGHQTEGAAILQVNETTWEVTLWFATTKGTFVTLVPAHMDYPDQVHEVPGDFFTCLR